MQMLLCMGGCRTGQEPMPCGTCLPVLWGGAYGGEEEEQRDSSAVGRAICGADTLGEASIAPRRGLQRYNFFGNGAMPEGGECEAQMLVRIDARAATRARAQRRARRGGSASGGADKAVVAVVGQLQVDVGSVVVRALSVVALQFGSRPLALSHALHHQLVGIVSLLQQ